MKAESASSIPAEYRNPSVEDTEKSYQPDTLPEREKLFEGIEQTLRTAYGDDPVDKHLWNVGKRYAKRRKDLERALNKTYNPGVEKPLDNSKIFHSNGTVLMALDQREHYSALAFALGEVGPQPNSDAIFLVESEDGSFQSPSKTSEGEAVTSVVRYISEHAPEVVECAKQTYPVTSEDSPNDPNRRLFYEHLVELFFLKPPDEVHTDHPNTMLWNYVFEPDRDEVLFLRKDNNILRQKHQDLFNGWHQARVG